MIPWQKRGYDLKKKKREREEICKLRTLCIHKNLKFI